MMLLKFTCTLYNVVDVVKCFVVYYILWSLDGQQIGQTDKRYKYYMTKIYDKWLCYIYHVVQVLK